MELCITSPYKVSHVLPTTYVVRGKVFTSDASVLLFTEGGGGVSKGWVT